MKIATLANRGSLGLGLALTAAVGGGCSNGSPAGAPTQGGPLATNGIEVAPVAVSATSASPADAGTPSPSELGPTWARASYAVAISVPPWTHCNVHPAGISNDPTRNADVQASADGTIRFYPPPKTWGTQLALDCTLNGSSQGVLSVDLSDPSTFTQVPLASLAPTGATVVPAMTGDLKTISQADLLRSGYPTRPDPVAAPRLYAQWEQAVTKPFKRYSGIGVFDLTLQASGYVNYQFFQGPLGFSSLWAGFIQDANGFASTQSSDGFYHANNGTQYAYYESLMSVPGVSCPSPPCSTLLWAGLGGYPTNGVPLRNVILQNGIAFGGNTNGGVSTAVFQQLWPITSGQVYLPPGTLAANDLLFVEGWTSASSNCSLSLTSHAYACFWFWDYTQGWSFNGYTYKWTNGNWSWAPTTAEYIVEDPTLNYYVANTSYGSADIEGDAWDTTGAEHADPGSGSDPNLAAFPVDTSPATYDILSYPEWPNGAYNISNPQDPIILVWNAAQ